MRARAVRCDRIPPRREPGTQGAIGPPAAAAERPRTSTSRGAWAATRTRRPAAGDNARLPGHDSQMAPRADCAEMDLLPTAVRPTCGARRDSATGRPNGDRESGLGLHAYPRWLKNVGHRVARSTIAGILKAEGIPPSRE